MRYEKRLLIKEKEMVHFSKLLESKDEVREDVTISHTVNFGSGIEMDVKLCGSSDGSPWTEAVLFHNGCEVCCSEPSESYDGNWELKYNQDTYVVFVEAVE